MTQGNNCFNFRRFSFTDEVKTDNLDFQITLGARMAQGEWPQRETLTFDAFATKLSQSPAGPKDGTCYTPATFRGINRKKNDADEIGIVALDADCGHSFEEIIDAVEKAGLAAIVHATHSHLTTESEISCRDYDKWADAHPGRDVAAYMREKRSYFVSGHSRTAPSRKSTSAAARSWA
jgi:hypothetical protein